jgi:CHAT domain-containing protein
VHDRSTVEFMRVFYRCWESGAPKAAALQRAMQEVRKSSPHPYYWAPFTLAGKAF